MRKKYEIVNILHSGRKGIRGEEVDERKYRGVINRHCYINFYEEIEQ